MVRFSDMLGGSGKPEEGTAPESPYAALANDEDEPEGDEDGADDDADGKPVTVPEPVPMSTFETPEAVLDRLTQYATSARASEPAAVEESEPEAESEPDPDPEPEPLSPTGDDFLPNARGIVRRGRSRKRHP